MNPPLRPDDEQPQSRGPSPGPDAEKPIRDPLLDDPAFAELLAGQTTPGPSPEAGKEPIIAEEVDAAAEAPIAEVVSEPPPLPRARPIEPRAAAEPFGRTGSVTAGPPSTPSVMPTRRPDNGPPPPAPRPRVYAACCVIGCLGIAILASIGFLAFVAIVVLGRLGEQIGEPESRHGGISGAAVRPGPVTRTSMEEPSKRIPLPGPFDAVGRGAGGRYLILRIPSTRQLAIFDPNRASVDSLGLQEPNSLFAGGASKLFVYRPGDRQIERWNLVTRRREAANDVPRSVSTATAMAVGASTDGLVFLFSRDSRGSAVTLIDGETLTETRTQRLPQLQNSDITDVRSSHDGTVLGVAAGTGSFVLTFRENQFEVTRLVRDGKPVEQAIPSPDGDFVYTPVGAYSLASKEFLTKAGGYFYTLPTDQGSGLYLSLDVNPQGRFAGSPRLHLAGSTDTVATLSEIRLAGMWANEKVEVPADQRLHLWPAAGLVAYLPRPESTTIELTKVDVQNLLKQSGHEYLIFGSDPPTSAIVGKEWRYRPEVWSSGDLRLRLSEAPQGMRFNRQEITWTPDAAGTFDVKIEATDPASKQTAEQRFRIVVTEPEEE